MIIIDIETTGLDPAKHAIIDIAAIEFESPTNIFTSRCHVRETASYDQKALEYNGFNIEDIYSPQYPPINEVLIQFQAWLNSIYEHTFAGQNPDFDVNFLKYNMEMQGMVWNFGHRKVDQHSIAYAKALQANYPIPMTNTKTSGFNSDEIMKFVGIPAEPRPHNSALNGALWETEAFSRLIYGRSALKQFEGFPIPEHLK